MFKTATRNYLHRMPVMLCLVLLLQGCATQQVDVSLTGKAAACQHWFEKLDDTLAEYDIEDPGTTRIEGFPQLRFDRFWASMRDEATLSDNAFAYWMEHTRELDASARLSEFANLPETAARQVLTNKTQDHDFAKTLQDCGQRLNTIDLHNPERKKHLLQQAQVPEAYQSWQRYLGGYALARYAAARGLASLHNELRAGFDQSLTTLPMQGKLLRYAPSTSNTRLSAEKLSAMLHKSYQKPLTIPELTQTQLQALFEQFAPIFEIDTRNNNDKIGTVTLNADGQPNIDTSKPVVYTMHAYTRWRGKVLLQLIYQIWLPAREKTGLFDLYGGLLDSVLWRVTLNTDGKPIAYDSIHACGCYYMLFPAWGYHAIVPKDNAEAVLSPSSIPDLALGQHLLLRLQSRTHYLQQVIPFADHSDNKTLHYGWQDAKHLRSLQMPDGSHQSLFDTDGIVQDSKRTERFLLWPFGVTSPGAMRQWGTHAIAFVGKRHFDDAFLLEQLLDDE